MRRVALVLGILLLCIWPADYVSAGSKGTATSCVLAVDGKYYIEGDCPVSLDDDIIIVGSGERQTLPYFAYLILEGESSAQGYWNGAANATHAQAPLGPLKKSGNCWIGDRARVCFNPPPVGRFSHAGWIGGATAGSSTCAMVQRFSDGKAEIVVETIDAANIGLGVRWLDGSGGTVSQKVQGTMFFDRAPPLSATGTFVTENYLRFQSQRPGLLEQLFGASSGLRVEYGDEGWFTLNLRGSSKALELLRHCQSTVQIAQSESEQETPATGETFRISERGIFRTNYGTWISVGDEYSRDRIAKFLSGLEADYQFTYGEDCMECVSISSGDIQLYFDTSDGKTIQSIHVYGGSFMTERGDQIGDLVSKNGNQLYCSDGMYEACSRYEADSFAIMVDRSKCPADSWQEGAKQPSGNFLRQFGDCERIEGLLLERPTSSDEESNDSASGN